MRPPAVRTVGGEFAGQQRAMMPRFVAAIQCGGNIFTRLMVDEVIGNPLKKRRVSCRARWIVRAVMAAGPALLIGASLAASPAPRPPAPAGDSAPATATAPSTAPADATMDWLLEQSSTQPSRTRAQGHSASAPASQPASPFAGPDQAQVFGMRDGVIEMSDGEKIHGRLSTTLDKPLRVWDEQNKQYRDIPFSNIRSIDAHIVWERQQPEWHFKESGSDIKEFTGKTYPDRQMQYSVTLANGKTISGDVSSPIYLQTPSGQKVFILHKRDKGEVGQTLGELVYVKEIRFSPPSTGG